MPVENTHSLDAIKEDIRRIRKSGRNAEIFGWAVLVAAAGVLWVCGTTLILAVSFGVLYLFGIFFLCTGKYIKDGLGSKTKRALLSTCVAAIPLCIGIVPIAICIQAAVNYRRFKSLPEKIQLLFNKPRRIHFSALNIIALVCVSAIGAASIVLNVNRLAAAEREKASSSASQSAPVENTKQNYHFTVTFPANYTATDQTEQVSGHTVNYTTFASTAANGGGDFKVFAYNYPDIYFRYSSKTPAILKNSVHAAVLAFVPALHGSIVTVTPSIFNGYPSEDATFTSQTFAGSKTGYLRVFYIQNYEFNIVTIGAGKDEFSRFANSFQFVGQ